MRPRFDFVVVGGGIIGLSIARALRQQHAAARILLLEKDATAGAHASGRNSGVLHSGIYYEPQSLKAELCITGARELRQYVIERGLRLLETGKAIVPAVAAEDGQLDLLLARGRANGVRVELLDERQLRECEPASRSASGRALWLPDTAVVDPHEVVGSLLADVRAAGVEVRLGAGVTGIADRDGIVRTATDQYAYGMLINAAGLHADRVAAWCGAADRYAILPFKGIYHALRPGPGLAVRRLVYPVPDLRVPFLGVHVTPSVSGRVFVGPTAIPALGRENYGGLRGMEQRDVIAIGRTTLRLALGNQQGFRRLAMREVTHLTRAGVARGARRLVPGITANDLLPSDKVGIRAQLVDLRTDRLMMDFVVERGERSLHVLNAVSPAFTSAFAFARYLVQRNGGV